jgi:hypothetical protein
VPFPLDGEQKLALASVRCDYSSRPSVMIARTLVDFDYLGMEQSAPAQQATTGAQRSDPTCVSLHKSRMAAAKSLRFRVLLSAAAR